MSSQSLDSNSHPQLYVEKGADGGYDDLTEEREYLDIANPDSPRAALCLSGGGIRSATYSLGVIQSLAKLGWFGKFTYLSTVSGGGYIGGWLTSWVRRKGIATVEQQLARNTPKGEPAELRQLRSGSNYLSPTTGLSGDALALLGTFVRNLLINWMLLVPLLIAATLIPLVFSGVVHDVINLPERREFWQTILFYGALGAAVLGLAYTAKDLPNGTRRQTLKNSFFALAFAPVVVGCVFFSLALANDRLADTLTNTYRDLVPSAMVVPRHVLFGGLGALVHLVGVWVGRLFFVKEIDYHDPLVERAFVGEIGASVPVPLKVIVVSLLSGAVAGYAVYGGVLLARAGKAALTAAGHGDVWSAIYATLAVPFLLLCYSLGSVLYLALLRRNSDEGTREWWSRAGGIWLLTAVVWVLAFAVCIWLPAWLSNFGAVATGGAGTLGGVLVAVAGFKSRQTATTKEKSGTTVLEALNIRVLDLLAIAFIVALFVTCAIAIVDTTAQLEFPKEPAKVFPAFVAGVHDFPLERFGIALLCVGFAYCLAWFTGVNAFSMHAMYGNRLARAFLGATREAAPPAGTRATGRQRRPHAFTGFDPDDDVAMRDAGQGAPNRLFHVINVALNILRASGNHLEWQERKAASFTVTPIRTGSQVTGYCDTGSIGGRGATAVTSNDFVTGITVGRAMTISGAAASPSMGYHSSKLIAIVMAFFNIRLGWWMPNPNRLEKAGSDGAALARLREDFVKTEPTFPLYSLLSEMFGNTTDASKSVYLSDGGHFENLALYEMVRRECREVVVVDAGCDPDYVFDDLERAMRIIRNDLGVEIEFPYGMPTADEIQRTGRQYTIGHIHYRSGKVGKLLYIKPGLNGKEPLDVARYASRVRANGEPFPHQSTADQFFDEPQFESYRALGQHSLRPLVDLHVPDIAAVEMLIQQEIAREKADSVARPEAWRAAQKEKEEGDKGFLDALGGLISWDKLPGLVATALGVTATAATLVPDAGTQDTPQEQSATAQPDKPPAQPAETPSGDAAGDDSPAAVPPSPEGVGEQPITDTGTGDRAPPNPTDYGPAEGPRNVRWVIPVRGFKEGQLCRKSGARCDDGSQPTAATIAKLRALDETIATCGSRESAAPLAFTVRGYASTSKYDVARRNSLGQVRFVEHPDSDLLNLALADSRAQKAAGFLERALSVNHRKPDDVLELWLRGVDLADRSVIGSKLAQLRTSLVIDRVDEIFDPAAAAENRRIDIRISSLGGCTVNELRAAVRGSTSVIRVASSS